MQGAQRWAKHRASCHVVPQRQSNQKEGGRSLWTGIIREDFPEETRFQVELKDHKNKYHWKWVRGEEREG